MCICVNVCVCVNVFVSLCGYPGEGGRGLSHIKNSLSAIPTAHLRAPWLTLVLRGISEEGSLCKLKGKRSVQQPVGKWPVINTMEDGGVRWQVAGTGLHAKLSFMGRGKDYRRQACTGLLVPTKCLVKGSSRYYYLVIFSSSGQPLGSRIKTAMSQGKLKEVSQ